MANEFEQWREIQCTEVSNATARHLSNGGTSTTSANPAESGQLPLWRVATTSLHKFHFDGKI